MTFFSNLYNYWSQSNPSTTATNPSDEKSKAESKGGWTSYIPTFGYGKTEPKVFTSEQEKQFCERLQSPFSSLVYSLLMLGTILECKEELDRETISELKKHLLKIDLAVLKEKFKDDLQEKDIENITLFQTTFTTSNIDSLFTTGMENTSLKQEIKKILNEGMTPLFMVKKKIDADLINALNHLLSYFESYTEKNDIVEKAKVLLKTHISKKVYIFAYEDHLLIKEGIKALIKKNPSSQFLDLLAKHLTADPMTARQNAYETLFALSSELEQLNNEKIKEKILALNKENGSSSLLYLPKETTSYFTMIGPCEVFERFYCRQDQHQVLCKLNQTFENWAKGAEDNNPSAKNVLLQQINQTAHYLHQPQPLQKPQKPSPSSSLKAESKEEEKPLGVWDKLKLVQGVTSQLSAPSSSDTSSLDKVLQILDKADPLFPVLKDLVPLLKEIAADKKEPSAIDKIDKIIEKLRDYKPILSGLIPLLTEITKDKDTEKESAVDKIDKIVVKLQPFRDPLASLIPLLTKLSEDRKSEDPTAIDKLNTLVTTVVPHIKVISDLNQTILKMLEEKVDKEPSAVDKVLKIVKKTVPLILTLEPLIKKLTDSSDKGPTALDQCLNLIEKTSGIVDKLDPVIKMLSEEPKGKTSFERIEGIVDKVDPIVKVLVPLMTKLTSEAKSNGSSSLETVEKILDKFSPHMTLISEVNKTILKMLEDKTASESSSIDKVLKILEKVSPLITTLEPLIKKVTDSSSSSASALDQCLTLIEKVSEVVAKLDPLIKQLSEKTEGKSSIDKVEGIVDKVDPLLKSLVPILTKLTSDSKSSDPSALERAEKILDKFVPFYEKLHPILQKLTEEPSSKEPNSLEKLDRILEKSSSLVKTLEPLIKKLSEPASSSSEDSFDKAGKLLDKMAPIIKVTSELIPLITKLTAEQNPSQPSTMDKIDGMLNKLNDLATKLSGWLPVVQKMTEPSFEPSSVDKINTALDKLNKAIESCSKMLEGIVDVFGGKKSSGPTLQPPLRKAAESLQTLINSVSRENIQSAINELNAILTTIPAEIGKPSWPPSEQSALTDVRNTLQTILSSSSFSLDEAASKKIKDLLTVTLAPYLATPLEKVLSNVGDILARVAAQSASKAGELIASQMGNQLAMGLNIVLEEVKKRIQGLTPASSYQPLVTAIDGLMTKIEEAKTTGSWKQLYDAFMVFKDDAKKLPPLAINGMILSFDSKKPSSSERSPFASALTTHSTAAAPSVPQSYEALQQVTNLQKQEFVRNTANLLVIKNVYETVCGILPNDTNFYTDLIEKAHEETRNEPKKFEAVLRSKFFQKIDEAHRDGKILLITKWFAKFVFRVMLVHANAWISKISTRFIDHIRTVIIQRNEKDFAQFKNGLVDNFNSYLGALGDAFKNALSNDTVHSHLNAKIEAELKKPSYNHGYTPEELYREAAKKAVETFMADISWTASIADWFKQHRLEDTSLPKRIVNELSSLVSGVLRVIVWGPQKIVNFLFIRRLKQSLIQSNGIDTLVNKSIDSVIDKNGYTHALNCVVRDQLKEVLERLKQSNNPSDVKEDPNQSNFQKKELARAVTNLLEVLNKSRCMTSDQLEAFLKNKTLNQKAQEALDNLFIPNVVDSTVKVINAAYESIMNKEQLEKQLCNFMSLVNKTFESSKEVDAAEVKRTENEITQLTDSILEITINDAIKTKFDHFTDNQTNTINEFIRELQSGLRTYTTALQPKLEELRKSFDDHNCSGANELLQQIRSEYDKFVTDCDQKFYFKIMVNKDISSPMKDQLKILSEETAAKYKELMGPMVQLLSMEEKLFRGEKVDNFESLQQQLLNEMFNKNAALSTWSNDDKFKPIAPMQFSFAQWQWFMDFVKNIVYSRIKERSDGLIEFMRLPYNYRYGIFHHLLLIPFVGRKKQS